MTFNNGENPLEQEFEAYASIMRIEELTESTMDIPQAINSVSRSLEIAERLKKLAAKTQNIELVEITTELRLELANTKNALADAVEEVAALKQKVTALEDKNLDTELVFKQREGIYQSKDGKTYFCPICLHQSNQRVPLRVREPGAWYQYFCLVCNRGF